MPSMISQRNTEASAVVQAYGSLTDSRVGRSEAARAKSVAALNRLLAHTMALCDLYKKVHWQSSGATYYEQHLPFEKHYKEQAELMDTLAERVQTLSGAAIALPHDVLDESRIAHAPRGRECARDNLEQLLDVHETILTEGRPLAREAADHADDGTNNLIVGDFARPNELQSWFIGEYLFATPQ
jgi:starvation-inducible DNA-binding protein